MERGASDGADVEHALALGAHPRDRLLEAPARELAEARIGMEEVPGLVTERAVDGEQLLRDRDVMLGGLADDEPLGDGATGHHAQRRDGPGGEHGGLQQLLPLDVLDVVGLLRREPGLRERIDEIGDEVSRRSGRRPPAVARAGSVRASRELRIESRRRRRDVAHAAGAFERRGLGRRGADDTIASDPARRGLRPWRRCSGARRRRRRRRAGRSRRGAPRPYPSP